MTSFRTAGVGCFKFTISFKEAVMIWFPNHKRGMKEKELKWVYIKGCFEEKH